VVEHLGIEDITNLVGFNYRTTELSAAVGIEQLKKIDKHVGRRERFAQRLSEGTTDLEGLTPPVVRPRCRHVYYVWALRFDEEATGVPRGAFSWALNAEGFPNFEGYTRPLYMLPAFQRRVAIGSAGFPFSESDVSYKEGLCPVAERLYERDLIGFEACAYDADDDAAQLLVEAVRKVHRHRDELVGLETVATPIGKGP